MTSILCEVVSGSKVEGGENFEKPHNVQFVPAKIGFSGPEMIEPFFNDFIKQNEDGSFSTALRGRPLTGKPIF